MADTRERLGSILLALASIAVTLGIVGIVGEVAVRYRERHRSSVPGSMALLFYRHARLDHALVHDNDYFGWVHVNSEGFRGADINRMEAPGTFRILLLGGSTVFDTFVTADSMTWPAQLQRWVQKLVPDRRVEVINAGVPGYRVVDQTISLLIGQSRFQADMVILYDGHNDLFGNLRSALTNWSHDHSRTPDEVVTKTPWVHWLERHSLLYCKLVDKLRAWQFATLSGKGGGRAEASAAGGSSGPADDGAAQFEAALNAFLAVARSYGMPVVLASPTTVSPPADTVPADAITAHEWRGAVPFAPPSLVLRGFDDYRQVFQRVAFRLHLPLIRAENFRIWGRRFYSPDDPIHFDDAGAACMGREMAYALDSAGLLPVSPGGLSAAARPSSAQVSPGRTSCQGLLDQRF